MISLFFIADQAGELDLLVAASDVDQALELWRDYYDLDQDDEPDRAFLVPGLFGRNAKRAECLYRRGAERQSDVETARVLEWYQDIPQVGGSQI